MKMSGERLGKDKQGYLGDIHTKSKPELEELLARQNSLLHNVSFVKNLSDKGSKIKLMITRIESAINSLEDVDDTADMLERMVLQSEATRSHRLEQVGEGAEEESVLHQMVTREESQTLVQDHRPTVPTQFINSYENVIKKAEKRPCKAKFRPNRSIRTKDVAELSQQRDIVTLNTSDPSPDSSRIPTIDEHKPVGGNPELTQNESKSEQSNSQRMSDGVLARGRLKYSYDESLDTQIYTGTALYTGASLITVEESVSLQQSQQKHIQDLQAKSAVEKLTQRLHVKMDTYHPEGHSSARYRDRDDDSDDDDSDADKDPLDYPD